MNFDGSRLIFIVGHYKSGSTWLLNMLSFASRDSGCSRNPHFP
jgi:hypothetical protein